MINQITRSDLNTGYNNIKRIIDAMIRNSEVKYKVSSEAPNTYEAMRRSFDKLGYFLVYNGGDHGLLGERYNLRFRALHDSMHYDMELSFSFEDEKRLSDYTKSEFMRLAYTAFGFTQWECYVIGQIINAEIRGQIEFYEKNKEYVKDQSKFILEYLEVA